MKDKLIFFITLLLFLLEGSLLYSTNPELLFKRYQMADGLSNNTVWCGIQDSYGFIWIGTSDGLNCYDGLRTKIYRNVPSDTCSLGNNYVCSLLEADGDLYVGTNLGLYLYHRSTDNFSPFHKSTKYGVRVSSEVRRIISTRNGLIWIATLGQGVFVYNPIRDELIQSSVHTSFIWDVCQGADGYVYASSMDNGLVCFNDEGTFLRNCWDVSSPTREGQGERLNCLLSIGDKIWFAMENNFMGYYRPEDATLHTFDITAQGFGSVRSLMEYDEHQLLLGTDNGLYLYDRTTQQFRRGDAAGGLWALSDPTVNALMRDVEGTLWVMTYAGGVNYMPRQLRRFNYYSIPLPDNASDAEKEVGPFCEAPDGQIYVGTRSGVWLFNPHTATFSGEVFRHLGMRREVRCLMLDGDRLWIGTYGDGLKVLNLQTGAVKSYTYQRTVPNSICGNEVLSLCKDNYGHVYVGTGWGLCFYNPVADNFTSVIHIGSMNSVTDLHTDRAGNVWAATSNNGVFRHIPRESYWKHFEYVRGDSTALTSNSVNVLFEDNEGTMWIGTNGGGLCSFVSETERFVHFDPTGRLLPDGVIHSIEQDADGNLWIAGNSGLYRIHPATMDNFQLFTLDDGLQGNQFTPRSSLVSSMGRLYFGGTGGFNSFTPSRSIHNSYQPPVYVAGISFPDCPDEQEAKRLLGLNAPFYQTRQIKLPYARNSFTLRFVALSYEMPNKNRYTYQLKGVDKEPIAATASNVAHYTHLAPGEYEFVVRGSNNDLCWNPEPATLHIIITPPWWLSTEAKLIYTLLFMSCVFAVAYQWNQYVKRKYKLRMERFKAGKEQELYKQKINFFVNLVHEVRTPLSLIRLPLEKLQEATVTAGENKYIAIIEKNVNYLLGITTQLLDFQKMENGALQLNLQSTHLQPLLTQIYNQFVDAAALKGIAMRIDMPAEEVRTRLDAEKINKVVVNLLSNALKYAHSSIEVTLSTEKEKIFIIVSDDGAGVPRPQQDKIFEAFYQSPDDPVATTGTGIGLAFSRSLAEAHGGTLTFSEREGGGSSFILYLPLSVTAEGVEQAETSPVEYIGDDRTEEETEAMTSEFGDKRFTVLLVEDNVELLHLTQESLRTWFKVLCATNGVKALEVLDRESVDVIVSDVMMPQMDGIELCRRVKQDFAYSHIPLILLTAKTTLESKVEGMESGADAYIEKPFSLKQLRRQIENLLKLRLEFHKKMSKVVGSSVSPIADDALSQRDVEFLEKINSVLQLQLADENFSMDSFADEMNMSRSSFFRKIKALSGMSPADYVKNFRLNKTAELIASGMRISEAAEQLGFTSSSYFAKCFKAKFGVLPKDYQSRLLE
ncbi:two-component regulator propeller domain-containing protein [Bacteroides sp. GD17]|jgi:signal transduction histidine kinase/ligand-binding sensor domain-containing protein/DNA-binding response OmpR family regulator|uniref:hybrid sensor histidine kinase/response regulator transcription factor n=1 Tax=Bacteroides sp. GD17 TaxID=3139826 RepID=UPI0025F4EFDC|nr:hybrid sensor histidine kinase/response regulator transcription factor [uncultured Bacteroides sp.]